MLLASLLVFAASALLFAKHTVPEPALAAAGDAYTAPATPYGSGAAMRNLLF